MQIERLATALFAVSENTTKQVFSEKQENTNIEH